MALVAGCAIDPPESQSPQTVAAKDELSFELKRYYQESVLCKTDSMRCAFVDLEYPVFMKRDTAFIRLLNDSIQSLIQSFIWTQVEPDENAPVNLESLAQSFIQTHQRFNKEPDPDASPWFITLKSTNLFQDTLLQVFEFKGSSYAGGVHQHHYSQFMNLDLKTGRWLNWSTCLTDSTGFVVLAEQFFRRSAKIKQGADLNEVGYFWGEGFLLPDQFALTKEGLLLHYNPEEAAGAEAGAIRFIIPWNQADKFIHPALAAIFNAHAK
jgi:hypothetical protein